MNRYCVAYKNCKFSKMATAIGTNEKPGFPSVEEWINEKKEFQGFQGEIDTVHFDSFIEFSTSLNDLNVDKFEEDRQVIKTYNNRRLSNSFPDIQQITDDSLNFTVKRRCSSFPDIQQISADSLNSTVTRKELSNLLSLMLVQGITNTSISEKGVASFLNTLSQKEHEDYIVNVLQSLVTVSKAAIDSPSEKQIFDYCQNVLEIVAANENDSVTVIYFFRSILLSRDTLLKHAALVLLHSYCSRRKFDLIIAPGLLSDVIALYREKDPKILELTASTVTAVIMNLKHTDQMKLVADVCLAVKSAMFRSKEQFLPGLCHPKGFASIFHMYEKVILKGIMKDKRLAVRALRQLILFASEDALQSHLCGVTSVLTCVLVKYMNEVYTLLKITIVETLITLIAKMGIKLEPYFRRLETMFFKLVKCDDRTVQLKSIRALCCLSRFNDQMDNLYNDIFEAIRREAYITKKKMMFTLRCVIKCSCTPFPKAFRHKFQILTLSLMDSPSDSIRIVASGCIGTMFGHIPDDECERVLRLYFLDDDQTIVWTLRHSKCTAILVALKESPRKLLTEEFAEKLTEILLSYLVSDIPKLISCAIAACGYYLLYKFQVQEEINPVLLDVLCETTRHSSEEIKNAFAVIIVFLASRITVPLPFVKIVVPHLINGTRDIRSKVRLSCELALVAILDLYNHEEIDQMYLNILDKDSQDALQYNLIHRLKIIAKKPKPNQTELDAFTRL